MRIPGSNGHHDPDLEMIPEGEEGARLQLREMLDSGEWWVLPIVGVLSAAVAHAVVHTLTVSRFDDAAPMSEGDLKELHTPDPAIRVLVVKRAVLPASALAILAGTVAGRTELTQSLWDRLDASKVVVLVADTEADEATANADRLVRWINEGGAFPRPMEGGT